jgi:hypothetical protein
MDINNKSCRHEYVKIFQRKYKDIGRRMVSTRGYLPTGFSNKDFSFLTIGSYCFCSKCRKRLFPFRSEAVKADTIRPVAPTTDLQSTSQKDNIWTEDSPTTSSVSSQEIDIEELQIEPTDVGEIVDQGISVNISEEEEEGEQ